MEDLPPISFDKKKYEHFYFCKLGEELHNPENEMIFFQPENIHEIIDQLQEEVIISAFDNFVPFEEKQKNWTTEGCGIIVSYGETLFINKYTCAINLLFWPKHTENCSIEKCKFVTLFYNYPKNVTERKKFQKHYRAYGYYKMYNEMEEFQRYNNGLSLTFEEIGQRKLKPLIYCLHLKNLIHLFDTNV